MYNLALTAPNICQIQESVSGRRNVISTKSTSTKG